MINEIWQNIGWIAITVLIFVIPLMAVFIAYVVSINRQLSYLKKALISGTEKLQKSKIKKCDKAITDIKQVTAKNRPVTTVPKPINLPREKSTVIINR